MIKENKFIMIIKYLKELGSTKENADRYFLSGSIYKSFNFDVDYDFGNIVIIKFKDKTELRLTSIWYFVTIDIIGDSVFISSDNQKQLFKISNFDFYHDSISFSLEHDILKIKESILDTIIKVLDIEG